MKTASHSPANKFLMDFGGILRRKVLTFQVKSRRKTRKFIAAELMGSALFGYSINNNYLFFITDLEIKHNLCYNMVDRPTVCIKLNFCEVESV